MSTWDLLMGQEWPTACHTCGGYGNRHDPIAHDAEPTCEHIWSALTDDDPEECVVCGMFTNPAPVARVGEEASQPIGLGSEEGKQDGKNNGVHPNRAREAAEGSDRRGVHGGPSVLDRPGSDSQGRVADGPDRGLTVATPGGMQQSRPEACVICGYPPADHEGDGQMLHNFVQLDDQCPITSRRCDRPCRAECIRGMASGPNCAGDGGMEP